MNTNDIINILRTLDNQDLSSTILPWQQLDISRAQQLPQGVTLPSSDDITRDARSLSVVKKDGDLDKAEYFCFIPASRKKWKVFIVDRFNKVLAQLEDYQGDITSNNSPYNTAFLLKIS